MKPTRNQIFLILVIVLSTTVFASTAFAADKPVWTIDHKKLNLPERGKLLSMKKWKTIGAFEKPDQLFQIQFTSDNKILVSFLYFKPQNESEPVSKSKKFDAFFVALLLKRENGELIRRVEWSLEETTLEMHGLYRFCSIYSLQQGGYAVLTTQRLQILDSSFNVIHDRALDAIKLVDGKYYLMVPLSGKFFIFGQANGLRDRRGEQFIEIIDSSTFEMLERFDKTNFTITDIWEDRLVLLNHSEYTFDSQVFEKKIGASQWNIIGLKKGSTIRSSDKRRYVDPRFSYNGAIIFKKDDNSAIVFTKVDKGFWLMIEDGKESRLPLSGYEFELSSNAPVIAGEKYKLSVIRRMLALLGKHWIEAYDLNTRHVLLATKGYSNSRSTQEIKDYAISPDGNSIILITSKKIELYTVKSKAK